MKVTPLIAVMILVFSLLITSCTPAPTLSVQGLCPAGPGVSWVTLKPESLEIFPLEVDVGAIHGFRFLAVASDGRAPSRYLGCGGALVYPQTENLVLSNEYRHNEKFYDFAQQSIVLDTDVVGGGPAYVYLVAINTERSSTEINEALPYAVQAIREAIHYMVTNPETDDLGVDITTYLLKKYPEYIQEQEIIDYVAFHINPEDWLWSGRHMAYGQKPAFSWRYHLYQFDGMLMPFERAPQPTENIIRNGDFEMWWRGDQDGVAPHWQAYSDGVRNVGWYKEEWPEAVIDTQAQLLEIGPSNPGDGPGIVAIHQTMEVVPNSSYDLTLSALMRTDIPFDMMNKNDYDLYWGVDYTGQGSYEQVADWFPMKLREQPRRGSNEYHEQRFGPYRAKLTFEQIRGRVVTGSGNFITLFIRGLKETENGVEVNFDIDNVVLLGPSPYYAKYPPTPTPIPQTNGEGQTGFGPTSDTPPDEPFTLPTPVPIIPTDPTSFLVHLRDNYDNINGQELRLEGIYLEQGNSSGSKTNRVLINLSGSGSSVFVAQMRDVQDAYTLNILNDTIQFFNNQDATVFIVNGNITINQSRAGCVLIRGVRGCPELEKDATFAFDGQYLREGALRNGQKFIE